MQPETVGLRPTCRRIFHCAELLAEAAMLSVNDFDFSPPSAEDTERANARVEFLRALTLDTQFIHDLWKVAMATKEAADTRQLTDNPAASLSGALGRLAKVLYTDERFAPTRLDTAIAWAMRLSDPPPKWLVRAAHDLLWVWIYKLLSPLTGDPLFHNEGILEDVANLDVKRFIDRSPAQRRAYHAPAGSFELSGHPMARLRPRQLEPPPRRARQPRGRSVEDLRRHCGWLVETRLNGTRIAHVAREASVTRQAVDGAIKRLERILELRHVQHRAGRPPSQTK